MASYFIEFERGGSFEIEFDSAAPQTAAAFRAFAEKNKEVPHEDKALHGRFSGEEVFFRAPLGEIERENYNTKPVQGVISFNPDPNWFAICIYYGNRVPEKPRYQNQFGHLKGDMNMLEQIGIRIWQEGPEKAVIKVLD